MLTDLRDAWRGLLSARGTTALAFALLMLGVTAATVTFSVVDAVALRPIPFPQSDRLVGLARTSVTSMKPGNIAPQDYFLWLARVPAFEGLAATDYSSVRFTGPGEPETVPAASATANIFEILRVQPVLGRAFSSSEETAANDALIISNELWMRRFHGDRNVVGQRVTLATGTRTIIGVMPPGFTIPIRSGNPIAAWVPYVPRTRDRAYDNPGRGYSMQAFGRLRPGATVDQARAQVEQANAQAATEFKRPGRASERSVVLPLRDLVAGPARSWLLLLLVAVTLVFVISGLNVATLLLARATVRARELATREALGASRARLARSLFLEGFLLSGSAVAAGCLLSVWGVAVVKPLLPPDLARVADIAINVRVLAAAAVTALVGGLALGAAPLWLTTRRPLVDVMKSGTGSVVGGHGQLRWLKSLVVIQLGFVVTLLVATTLAVTTFIRVTTMDLGFDRHNVLSFSVPYTTAGVPKDQLAAAAESVRQDVLARVRAVPGVLAAAVIRNGVPLSGGSTQYSLTLPNGIVAEGDNSFETREVSADYFATMGVPLIGGRPLQENDQIGAPLVAVINQLAAKEFFVGDPVGQVFTWRGPTTIVGVVGNVRIRGPEMSERPEMYRPIGQAQASDFDPNLGELVVRVSTPSADVADRIAQAIRATAGVTASRKPQSIEDDFSKLTAPRRFNAGLMAVFGLVAAMMAAIGVYGMMAFAVAQQTRVIGLKIALGASSGRVLSGVFRESLVCAGLGSTLGLLGAWAAGHTLTAFVFDMNVTDGRIFLAVAATTFAISATAALVPARRAARVDPLTALRAD